MTSETKSKRKRKPVKQVSEPEIEPRSEFPENHTGLLPPPPEGDNRNFLRFKAGLWYEQDLQGRSVADLYKQSEFAKLPRGTLERWSTRDKWVARRKIWRENLAAMAAKTLSDKLAKERLRVLEQAEQLDGETVRALKMTAPRSYEGVLNSWVKLQEFSEDMRVSIASKITADFGGGYVGPTTGITPQLSVEEKRAAALAVVRARQAKTLKEIEKGPPAQQLAPQDDDPASD